MNRSERILGLDVGDARIGVAVSDPLGITAQPREVIRRVSPEQDVEAVRAVVKATQAARIVVGLPLTEKGTVGHQAEKVLAFAALLREKLGIEIDTMDERFTTVVAQQALVDGQVAPKRRKSLVDKLAAQQILQTYLDRARLKPGESPAEQGRKRSRS